MDDVPLVTATVLAVLFRAENVVVDAEKVESV